MLFSVVILPVDLFTSLVLHPVNLHSLTCKIFQTFLISFKANNNPACQNVWQRSSRVDAQRILHNIFYRRIGRPYFPFSFQKEETKRACLFRFWFAYVCRRALFGVFPKLISLLTAAYWFVEGLFEMAVLCDSL